MIEISGVGYLLTDHDLGSVYRRKNFYLHFAPVVIKVVEIVLFGSVYSAGLYVQEVFELVEKVLFMLHQQHQALHADNKQGRQIHFILIRIQTFCSIRIRIHAFAESGSTPLLNPDPHR